MQENKSIQNLAPLAQIDRLAQEQRYGTLQLTLEIHDRKIVGMTGAQFSRKVYRNCGGSDVVDTFAMELLGHKENKSDGTYTVTANLRKGEVKEAFFQTNVRQVFSEGISFDGQQEK
jgi:hypothetical protein